jgi:hypothetical protein
MVVLTFFMLFDFCFCNFARFFLNALSVNYACFKINLNVENFRLNDVLVMFWPFNKKVLFLMCCQLHKSLPSLLLRNYCCNFIQTLQEWQVHVASLVVHIIGFSRFNDICQSNGILMLFFFSLSASLLLYHSFLYQDWSVRQILAHYPVNDFCVYCYTVGATCNWLSRGDTYDHLFITITHISQGNTHTSNPITEITPEADMYFKHERHVIFFILYRTNILIYSCG